MKQQSSRADYLHQWHINHRQHRSAQARLRYASMTEEQRRAYYERGLNWRHANKDKIQAYSKEYYRRDTEKRRLVRRRYGKLHPEVGLRASYKHNYGITLEQYDQMLLACGNKCQICGTPHNPAVWGGRLHVDHDHATKRVRGLLCRNCNTALGRLHDNETIVLKLLDYIRVPT